MVKEASLPLVRIAELEIDPAQLENYNAALKVEIAQSVASEPGVLAIYAVAEKETPSKLHLLEIYADAAAYEAHVRSPHFLTYKEATKDMVRSLRLIDATPVLLSAKAGRGLQVSVVADPDTSLADGG